MRRRNGILWEGDALSFLAGPVRYRLWVKTASGWRAAKASGRVWSGTKAEANTYASWMAPVQTLVLPERKRPPKQNPDRRDIAVVKRAVKQAMLHQSYPTRDEAALLRLLQSIAPNPAALLAAAKKVSK